MTTSYTKFSKGGAKQVMLERHEVTQDIIDEVILHVENTEHIYDNMCIVIKRALKHRSAIRLEGGLRSVCKQGAQEAKANAGNHGNKRSPFAKVSVHKAAARQLANQCIEEINRGEWDYLGKVAT